MELKAVNCGHIWYVNDAAGRRWWPDDAAQAEIATSGNPLATVLRICRETPDRGVWLERSEAQRLAYLEAAGVPPDRLCAASRGKTARQIARDYVWEPRVRLYAAHPIVRASEGDFDLDVLRGLLRAVARTARPTEARIARERLRRLNAAWRDSPSTTLPPP